MGHCSFRCLPSFTGFRASISEADRLFFSGAPVVGAVAPEMRRLRPSQGRADIGPTLGLKKSSSLESLQTVVHEMQMQEEEEEQQQQLHAGGVYLGTPFSFFLWPESSFLKSTWSEHLFMGFRSTGRLPSFTGLSTA